MAIQPTERYEPLWVVVDHMVRGVAVEHPAIFPLVATRHPAAPWLRPPLRSLRIVEEFLDALTQRGFSDRQAVEAYRVFSSFLVGHLLLEVSARGATTSPVEEALDEGAAHLPSPTSSTVELTDYPTLVRTAGMLAEDHTDEEFESALEALLDRMDRVLSQ